MSYKLYTDKSDEFSCEISVKNASTKDSIARLVVESTEGINLIFNGKIEGNKCVVPIKRLKGLLEENTKGNIHLEIIVEDTFFVPWKSDFLVENHTSVKVKINENEQIFNKPIVKIKENSILNHLEEKKSNILPLTKKKNIDVYVPLREISSICESFDIRRRNIQKRKLDFFQILKEYFKHNREYKNHMAMILNRLPNFMR
jgi:hypothetical protein